MHTITYKVTIIVKVETEFNEEYAKALFETNSSYSIPSVEGVKVIMTRWEETETLASMYEK